MASHLRWSEGMRTAIFLLVRDWKNEWNNMALLFNEVFKTDLKDQDHPAVTTAELKNQWLRRYTNGYPAGVWTRIEADEQSEKELVYRRRLQVSITNAAVAVGLWATDDEEEDETGGADAQGGEMNDGSYGAKVTGTTLLGTTDKGAQADLPHLAISSSQTKKILVAKSGLVTLSPFAIKKDGSVARSADGIPLYSTAHCNKNPHKVWYHRGAGRWEEGIPANANASKYTQIRIPKTAITLSGAPLISHTRPTYNTSTADQIKETFADPQNIQFREAVGFLDIGRPAVKIPGKAVRFIPGLPDDEEVNEVDGMEINQQQVFSVPKRYYLESDSAPTPYPVNGPHPGQI